MANTYDLVNGNRSDNPNVNTTYVFDPTDAMKSFSLGGNSDGDTIAINGLSSDFIVRVKKNEMTIVGLKNTPSAGVVVKIQLDKGNGGTDHIAFLDGTVDVTFTPTVANIAKGSWSFGGTTVKSKLNLSKENVSYAIDGAHTYVTAQEAADAANAQELTMLTDDLDGTSLNDTFVGNSLTYTTGDHLDGMEGGTDKLNLLMITENDAIVQLDNIDQVNITAEIDTTMNAILWNDVTQSWSRNSSEDLQIENLQSLNTTIGVEGGNGSSVVAEFRNSLIAGDNDTASVALKDADVGLLQLSGSAEDVAVENVNISVTGDNKVGALSVAHQVMDLPSRDALNDAQAVLALAAEELSQAEDDLAAADENLGEISDDIYTLFVALKAFHDGTISGTSATNRTALSNIIDGLSIDASLKTYAKGEIPPPGNGNSDNTFNGKNDVLTYIKSLGYPNLSYDGNVDNLDTGDNNLEDRVAALQTAYNNAVTLEGGLQADYDQAQSDFDAAYAAYQADLAEAALNSPLESLTITGSGALTIEAALGGNVKTVNASQNTGGVDLSLVGATAFAFTGGSGADRLLVDLAVVNGGDDDATINMGTGANTLAVTGVSNETNIDALDFENVAGTVATLDLVDDIYLSGDALLNVEGLSGLTTVQFANIAGEDNAISFEGKTALTVKAEDMYSTLWVGGDMKTLNVSVTHDADVAFDDKFSDPGYSLSNLETVAVTAGDDADVVFDNETNSDDAYAKLKSIAVSSTGDESGDATLNFGYNWRNMEGDDLFAALKSIDVSAVAGAASLNVYVDDYNASSNNFMAALETIEVASEEGDANIYIANNGTDDAQDFMAALKSIVLSAGADADLDLVNYADDYMQALQSVTVTAGDDAYVNLYQSYDVGGYLENLKTVTVTAGNDVDFDIGNYDGYADNLNSVQTITVTGNADDAADRSEGTVDVNVQGYSDTTGTLEALKTLTVTSAGKEAESDNSVGDIDLDMHDSTSSEFDVDLSTTLWGFIDAHFSNTKGLHELTVSAKWADIDLDGDFDKLALIDLSGSIAGTYLGVDGEIGGGDDEYIYVDMRGAVVGTDGLTVKLGDGNVEYDANTTPEDAISETFKFTSDDFGTVVIYGFDDAANGDKLDLSALGVNAPNELFDLAVVGGTDIEITLMSGATIVLVGFTDTGDISDNIIWA